MSRGPGTVQQLILEAARTGKVYPLLWIAKVGDYDITKLSVRQSFRRAARTLAATGKIEIWTINVPTATNDLGFTYDRDVACIMLPEQNDYLTDDDWDNCRLACYELFFGEQAERDDEQQRLIDNLAALVATRPRSEEEEIDELAEKVIRVLELDDAQEADRDRITRLPAGMGIDAGRADAIADRVMARLETGL